MVERSGLLYETEEGYTLGDHLTMQEFLAGCYLGEHYAWEDPEGYAAFLREAVGRSWWREVFLLAAGFLAEKPGFAARQFLRQIAGQGEDPEEQLMALALAGRGLLQLRARRRRPTWYGRLVQHLSERLDSILRDEPVAVFIEARQEVGLMLGQLYGMPGDGIGVGDPRFVGTGGLPDFVEIPGGEFWMGSDDSDRENERPQHKVVLSVYEVAKYPTTNAMYKRFIDDNGYADARWWSEAIEDGYWKEGQVRDWAGHWYRLPRYWDDDRRNNPSQPVVGVSWYEAVGYCRWLTAARGDGYVYRLPTEAEWEQAARGPEGWAYPWGDNWQAGFCNSKEAGLEQTSPVGLFPEGVTREGLHDMVGNVWEWCYDWYTEDAYTESQRRNPTGPESGTFHVLRGGSWYSDGPSRCRCDCRFRYVPWSRTFDRGFRCVRILS
jgi:formylglycine-generating enzyme required for sulfatase activity